MKQSRREDTSAIPATSTVPSPTLLQIMDFIYGLEHSPGMRFTLNWSIYLTELRNENGDAVFTGDIYTHDRTEPPDKRHLPCDCVRGLSDDVGVPGYDVSVLCGTCHNTV